MTAPGNGPFETAAQARELAAVRAVYAAFRASPGARRMAPLNHRMLADACTVARVEIGTYDDRILVWLAGFEPETCAVIAGLITAAATGQTGQDAGRLAEIRAILAAFDWELDDRQLALEAIDRIAEATP